jgi:hypothetical protein
MSDDDFDADAEGGSDDSNLVKDLRKQLKEAKKAREEADLIIAEANKVARSKSVADSLTAKGVRPELAKFYTAEDASSDAVNAWVTENAELFGIDTDDGADEATREAADVIARASSNAPATKIGSPNDILHDLNTLTHKELVEKGHLAR